MQQTRALLRGVYLPAFGHDINVGATELSDDPYTQVAQTIDLMSGYARADGDSSELAADVAAAERTGDPFVDTFYDLGARVGGRLRFVPDEATAEPFTSFCPRGPVVETLVRPIDLRRMSDPNGDCDDFAMTTAARLRAAGVKRVSFCTVAVDPSDSSRFSHVYVVGYRDGGAAEPWSGYPVGERVPMDTSHGDYPGWECPNPFGLRREWPIDGAGDRLAVAGLVAAAGVALFAYTRGG